MKVLSVGDLHGKSIWEKIDASQYDRVIFTGDLYDAFEYGPEEIHTNALAVVQWAHEMGNVSFTIGNHDAHYFKWQTPVFQDVRGSGYTDKQLHRAYHLYIENKELFRVAYRIGDYLWTHAGLSQMSYSMHFEPQVNDIMNTQGFTNLAQVLNYMWDINCPAIFKIPMSRGGNDSYGSILWADITDTSGDPLEGYHQIVGHSRVEDIIHKELNDDTSITYIDCLDRRIEKFYEIEI